MKRTPMRHGAATLAVACLALTGAAACGDDSASGPLRERARELAAVAEMAFARCVKNTREFPPFENTLVSDSVC